MVDNLVFGVRDLHAEVKGWKYWLTVTPFREFPSHPGRRIRLECQTAEAHFLPYCMKLILFISENQNPTYRKIISESPSYQEGMEVGQINYYPIGYEEKFPYTEGEFWISRDNFQHIVDILESSRGKEFIKVTLYLSLFGLDLGLHLEEDKWPEERELSIINVTFALATLRSEKDD